MKTQKERRTQTYKKAASITQDIRTLDYPAAVNIVCAILGRAEQRTRQMKEYRNLVIDALRPFAVQEVGDTSICHVGYVAKEQCCRCGPILRARALIEKFGGKVNG